MEINLLTLVGIALAAMFLGYFFGLFEGRGQGYKRRKKEEAAGQPAEPATQAEHATQAEPPSPTPPDKGLLRLALDAARKPVLELDGQPLDVSRIGPDQRRRLIDLMLIMRPWVEASTPARPSAPPRVVTPPAQSAPVPIGPRQDRVAAAPIAARSSASASSSAPAAVAGRPVGAREAPEPGPPTTMVGQIDAILRARLTGSPLADRAIRLTESPEGGAIIWIGDQGYTGLADVPDPDAKAAIKAAITEWEEKYTPGYHPGPGHAS